MGDDRRQQYEQLLAKVAPKARPRCGTLSGPSGAEPVDADELYDAATLAAQGFDPDTDLGFPGSPPFTRGVQPNMYRGRLWTMRQYAGFGTAEESNRRYHFLLDQGQTGLSVAFDLPTQMGLDSDHPLARGEVGRVGVAIDSLGDMRRLMDGLPLDRISTSMTINATA
ncbi:MAG: methylmalonyl-CoA mutase, partial [Deltaproteobacteria bacterium]|nr:methylmalonyl-CoA mutase [Deltaproteobacteria bacterium]